MTASKPFSEWSEGALESRHAELCAEIADGAFTGEVLNDAIREKDTIWHEIIRIRVGDIDPEEYYEPQPGDPCVGYCPMVDDCDCEREEAERWRDKPCKEGTDPDAYGYARVRINGKRFLAHRVAWEEANGPIPKGMNVCHHCDNPPCVELTHLFIGTQADNMRDMAAKGRSGWSKRTHCPHGHEYTEKNTWMASRVVGRTHRVCLTCKREKNRRYMREYNKRRKAKV